jgi:putative ABC transport system substrate-binding protein
VTLGLITSLAHPRGNVTGVISFADSLAPKRIELLREMMPTVKRIGLLGDSTDPTTKSDLRAMMPLAVSLGLTLVVADTANPDDIDAAMAKLAANRVDVIYLYGGTTLAFNMRARMLEVANRMRLPVVGARSQMADAGAIFSYGPSLIDQLRRSAPLVDKILKGANPGDMPVEQATLFELVINAKAAKALGITISQSILLRADRVIE